MALFTEALTVNENTREFILRLNDFRGGLNTRDVESLIRDNELSSVRNFTYDSRGGLTIRYGFTRLFSSEYNSDPIMTICGFYRTGASREEIVTSGTSIGKRVAEGGTVTDIKTGLTGDGLRFYMHQYLDKLFMGNGTDNLMNYNGTDVTDIGYTVPGTNCTATEGAAGVLGAGTYKYKITFKYVDGESNECSPESSVTIIASKRVALTSVPTGGARVTGRGVYRTVAGGSVYKLVGYINDNTTTTYDDNINDSGLGADIDTDNLYTIIRSCKGSVNHKSRLWFWGNPTYPETIFYSKSLSPEANPALYYWDIGKGAGDEIVSLKVNLGALVIFKKYSTWIISGDTPVGDSADMVLEQVNPSIGAINDFTVAHAGNDLLFLTPRIGIHRLHRIILANTESMDAEALSDKISRTIDEDIKLSLLDLSHGECWNNKYYCFVPSLTATDCDLSLVLDLSDMNPEDERTIRWTIYDNMDFKCSAIYRDDEGESLHTGSTTQGHIYALESGSTDDGQLITAYAYTKNFDFNSLLSEKVFRTVAVSGRASEDYELKVREYVMERNYTTGSGFTIEQHVHSFAGGGTVSSEDILYDTISYDDVTYDTETIYTATVIDFTHADDMQYPGYKLKLKIEDVAANNDFVFYGFEVRGYYGMDRVLS